MRTSAFVPTNIPIIAGMLLSAPTPFNTFLWQWVNQTYNAGLNYGNKNASCTTPPEEAFKRYLMAVIGAISLATLMRRGAAPLMHGREGTLMGGLINSSVNFTVVALGSALNMASLRWGETEKGINVLDPDSSEVVGVSRIAAKMGIV
jgi:hypothetical protein